MAENHDSGLHEVLSHVRAALTAEEHGAPVRPALVTTEETLLRMLGFSTEEIDAYQEAEQERKQRKT